jgi:hemolysin III
MSSTLDSLRPPPDARRADGIVQGTNVVLAIAGCIALALISSPGNRVALAIYGAGLLAMTGCSALYAWGRGGPRHTLFRHLDQAAIFVMIAGTYTPFTAIALSGPRAHRLLEIIWAIALTGVLIKMLAPRRFERLSIPLYLLMGWIVLYDPTLLLNLSRETLTLLLAGGVLYTAGIAFHLSRLRYQEAIWHGFVLAGAACHYAAVVRTVG